MICFTLPTGLNAGCLPHAAPNIRTMLAGMTNRSISIPAIVTLASVARPGDSAWCWSESEPRPDLDRAITSGRRDSAHGRRVRDVAVGVAERGVVEGAKRVQPQFKARPFVQSSVFGETHVPGPLAGTPKQVVAGVAVSEARRYRESG